MTAGTQRETTRMVRALGRTTQKALATQPVVIFGTVTSTTPLKVLVDGTATHVPAYNYQTAALAHGDRVLLHYVRNEYIVAGVKA